MSKTGVTITVTGKGNLGFSPQIGQQIVRGQTYTIDEGEFSDQLYRRPKGWVPPAERKPAKGPAAAGKTKKTGGE